MLEEETLKCESKQAVNTAGRNTEDKATNGQKAAEEWEDEPAHFNHVFYSFEVYPNDLKHCTICVKLISMQKVIRNVKLDLKIT